MGVATQVELTRQQIETINNLLSGLKFGNIVLIVQDGKIIQIDKTEKHRL
ncbi:MAG: YezD family protein [Butyrivibrio sp.]|nr:YezD family protein [Butyrivibrio sp.]MBP3783303.1 YezD family protein [Butyrivibrio sp.]MBP3814348.1 YezD family protein [Butyrivibrio sp.]